MRPIRPSLAIALALACTLAWHMPAASQQLSATRVDDSGTVVSAPLVAMRWRNVAPGRGSSNDVDGDVDVALRLNLAPWLNREVRLYLVLEPSANPALITTARWRASGRLLPGSVRSGARTLVYQGRVTEPSLQEALHFTLTTDGGRLSDTQALQFHIEADGR